jgi:hypothetical protein
MRLHQIEENYGRRCIVINLFFGSEADQGDRPVVLLSCTRRYRLVIDAQNVPTQTPYITLHTSQS